MLERVRNRYHHEIGKEQAKKYENNKGRLQEQAQNKYRGLSNEEKDIKKEYWRNRCKNISEDK